VVGSTHGDSASSRSPRRPILVTGAAGFIGSHVAEGLAARGDTVVGVDNFHPYYDPGRKRANLQEAQAAGGERLTFVEGDIRDRDLIRSLFDRYRFRAVAHLAALAGVRASVENPAAYYDVNVQGSLVLLDAAAAADVEVFVGASTSSVYGLGAPIPFAESDRADRPLAPYAASKRAVELLAHSYHHLYGLNITMLRFFTVYGPRGRPDMLAYKVLHNILSGDHVPLYNGGQMHRDWTYVGDVTAGVIAALDRPLGYEIINIGRGEPVLLADFVRLLEEVSGNPASLTPAPPPDTDLPYTYADVSKARRLLGYEPATSVAEGVRAFWEWFRAAVPAGD